jgi:hypothetical protein
MTQLLPGARAFLFLFLAGGTSAQADGLLGWVGTWRNGDNRIAMSLRDAKLFADGEAYYPAKDHDPFPNVGDFKGSGSPRNDHLTIRDYYDGELTCEVIMTRDGDTLTVLNHDPRCGGRNVTFKGVYKRVKR